MFKFLNRLAQKCAVLRTERLIKLSIPSGVLLAVLMSAFISIAQSPSGKDGFIHHVVRQGETVSLLCIQYYGYYSQALGKAIQRDNPALKNIDRIAVGQKILLKEPVEKGASGKKSGVPDSDSAKPIVKTDTVFIKQIDLSQGVVTYLEGSSFLKKSGSSKSIPLAVNTMVNPGDRIETTSDGRVEILINRESVVRMKENSILEFDSLRNVAEKKGKTRFNFSLGSVWTKVKKFKDSISRFELELPTAVAGVHGTVYQTSVHKDSSSEVEVFEGEVAVSGNQPPALTHSGNLTTGEVTGPREIAGPGEVSLETWTRIVRSMQKIHIDKSGIPDSTSGIKEIPRDSWTLWNEERDRRISEIFSEQ